MSLICLIRYLEFAPVLGDGAFVLDVVRGEVDGDVAHLDHPPRQGVTERVAAAAADAVAPVASIAAPAADTAEGSYGHDDLRTEMLTYAVNQLQGDPYGRGIVFVDCSVEVAF